MGTQYIHQHIEASKAKPQYAVLEDAFKNCLVEWVNQGVTSLQIYKKRPIIETLVLPNEDFTKALILVNREGPREDVGKVDSFSGKLIEDKWNFYDKGIPSFTTELELIMDTLSNKSDFLINNALNKFIDDGLIKRGKLSNKYFDKWLP